MKKKGTLFWITGYSGAGKTSIAKKSFEKISNKYGKTIFLNGDDIRSIFNLKGYTRDDRKKIGFSYAKLFKKITDQNINVLFAGVVLIKEIRNWNKKNIKNYIEIFIDAKLSKIKKKKFKLLYKNKKSKLVGIDIKADLPKKPHIIIKNNFTKSIDLLSKELLKKIDIFLNKINK